MGRRGTTRAMGDRHGPATLQPDQRRRRRRTASARRPPCCIRPRAAIADAPVVVVAADCALSQEAAAVLRGGLLEDMLDRAKTADLALLALASGGACAVGPSAARGGSLERRARPWGGAAGRASGFVAAPMLVLRPSSLSRVEAILRVGERRRAAAARQLVAMLAASSVDVLAVELSAGSVCLIGHSVRPAGQAPTSSATERPATKKPRPSPHETLLDEYRLGSAPGGAAHGERRGARSRRRLFGGAPPPFGSPRLAPAESSCAAQTLARRDGQPVRWLHGKTTALDCQLLSGGAAVAVGHGADSTTPALRPTRVWQPRRRPCRHQQGGLQRRHPPVARHVQALLRVGRGKGGCGQAQRPRAARVHARVRHQRAPAGGARWLVRNHHGDRQGAACAPPHRGRRRGAPARRAALTRALDRAGGAGHQRRASGPRHTGVRALCTWTWTRSTWTHGYGRYEALADELAAPLARLPRRPADSGRSTRRYGRATTAATRRSSRGCAALRR